MYHLQSQVGRNALAMAYARLSYEPHTVESLTEELAEMRDSYDETMSVEEAKDLAIRVLAHVEQDIAGSDSVVAKALEERLFDIDEDEVSEGRKTLRVRVRMSTRALLAAGKPGEPHYRVTVMALGQSYGGPEEGGWYYETGENVAEHHCWGNDALQRLIKHLGEEFPRDRFGRYSAAGGEDYSFEVQYAKEEPKENFPKRRPHYE